MKKIPMRRCVVTQERFPKKELIRIVRTPEGSVEIDTKGKRNGHGAYIQKSMATLEKAKKSKALERALETKIDDDIYAQLEAMMHE